MSGVQKFQGTNLVSLEAKLNPWVDGGGVKPIEFYAKMVPSRLSLNLPIFLPNFFLFLDSLPSKFHEIIIYLYF